MIEKLQQYLERQIFVALHVTGEERPLLVAVDQIDTETVRLKPWTLHGNYIENPRILISRIEKVLPLKARYSDPFFVKLREIKARILKIKLDMNRI